jgi:hypothetical protein
MADYSAVKSYLEKNNLQYFTFSPNSEKPIKAVIRHLPLDTPAEDISNSLEGLGFSVINVRQLTTNRRAPKRQTHLETLPLFLVTLIRNAKSQEIFKLNSLHHIIIKVESYRAQTGLTQCYNCRNFGHVWTNCKPPRCLWCGGGHLHRECPEKTNTESTPRCCNCTLLGENPHPASYRGCSHAKGEKHSELPRDPLGLRSSQSYLNTELHYVKTIKTSTHRHRRQNRKASGTPCSSMCHKRNFRNLVSPCRLLVRLRITL